MVLLCVACVGDVVMMTSVSHRAGALTSVDEGDPCHTLAPSGAAALRLPLHLAAHAESREITQEDPGAAHPIPPRAPDDVVALVFSLVAGRSPSTG